ncbi:sensory box protein [Rhodococcus aetherivorans]|uniref:Sensory box protein n=1 Tax=Rhodococcus aetherivorans TaxID=191292 RepID=A0ABQ0YHK3_9NOCA|nr:sensory box protein [Rhodococcus aetherivorans]
MLSMSTFLAEDPETGMDPVIERSWLRSSACGVAREAELSLPYDDHIDDDSRLFRAAEPVLERLVGTMSNMRHALLLADPDARIIHRWVGAKSLHGPLDNARIALGFGFTEEFAGTNGVGTALEEARVVTISGEQHFAERLFPFACVGVPIRNPVRGTIEGVLDFSCLATDFNPLMTSLLVEVAEHIETRFAQQASASESALLECFVKTSRVHRGPVVGMRPNMFLTNTSAAEQVNASDQAMLWELAGIAARHRRDTGVAELSAGRYSFRMTLIVEHSGIDAGVVLRLNPEFTQRAARDLTPRSRPSPLTTPRTRSSEPAKAGRSVQWNKLIERMTKLADNDEPVAFTGEDGTGKLWAAKRLASMRGGGLRIFDAEQERGTSHSSLPDRCRSALAAGESVIVRRIDKLTVPVRAELGELVRNAEGPLRLMVTCTDDPRDTVVRTIAGFAHQLWLPPLAQRPDDIVDIVPELLAEIAPDRVVTCAMPARQVLMRYSWPGNVAELRDVLAVSLAEAKGSQLQVSDLPGWLMKRAHRRKLTPMEQSERDLIIDALLSVDNNRAEAARVLGIGRATLYRKLRSLGISNGTDLTV